MNNAEESKTKEINKCRSLLKLVNIVLESLHLSDIEKDILHTIRSHMNQIELEFNKLLLENMIEPPEQEEKIKPQRIIKR